MPRPSTACFDAGSKRGPTAPPSSPRRSWRPSRRSLPSAPRTPTTSSASDRSDSWSSPPTNPPASRWSNARRSPSGSSLDAGQEDYQVRLAHGVEGLRRCRILRVTAEAREQGGLLSYEDLAFRLFNCGVRTIVRDVQALRRREIEVPTRGQQQDIGPGQTHRVQAVRLYLQGLEANEIARRLYHTLGSIENYVTTFARVVILVNKGYADDEIAFVIRRSSPLVAAYRKLYEEFQAKPGARRRLREILARVQAAMPATKKGGRRP